MLNDLTKAGHEKQPIILNPQRGWDELRQRLARDLTVDNGVLPMQLNLALRGLEQLRFLTVAEYRRIGGLAGLEVAHLRNHVRKSAHKNGFSERTLIFFLRQLVNPADQNKTIECSIEQVLRAVPVEGITAEQTTRAFEHLRQVTIVKKVPLSEAEARWSLEHDYLCRVIENAARLVDPGTQEAQQWHETYNATSEVASLKVLLTGWSWSVFVALFQRRIQHALIRRFVRRGFAAVLTALLIATSMTCTIAFLFWQKYTVTQEVNKLLYGQSGQEIQTLARSSESVRHMYVRSALEKELLASSLTSWQDRRRALLGIDPSRRDSLFKQVISGCAYFDWSKTLLTSTMRDIQSKRPKCGLFAYEMLLPYELLNLEPGIALGRLLSISGARQCFSSRGIDDDWAALDRRLDTGMAREIGRAAENIAEADRSQWIWAALRHLEDFQQQHAICSERSHVAILRFLQSSITALKQEDTVSAYKQLARYGEIDRVASNNNLALLGEVFTKLAARLSEQQAMDLLTSLLVEREGVAATGVLTWRASSAALSVLIQKAPYRERSRILLLSISHIAENVDDSVPVHQDLIKTLITGLNKDDLLDAYYRFSKRLDQEYAEDQHPLHLLCLLYTSRCV